MSGRWQQTREPEDAPNRLTGPDGGRHDSDGIKRVARSEFQHLRALLRAVDRFAISAHVLDTTYARSGPYEGLLPAEFAVLAVRDARLLAQLLAAFLKGTPAAVYEAAGWELTALPESVYGFGEGEAESL